MRGNIVRSEEWVVMRYSSVLDLHYTYFGEWSCILFSEGDGESGRR